MGVMAAVIMIVGRGHGPLVIKPVGVVAGEQLGNTVTTGKRGRVAMPGVTFAQVDERRDRDPTTKGNQGDTCQSVQPSTELLGGDDARDPDHDGDQQR